MRKYASCEEFIRSPSAGEFLQGRKSGESRVQQIDFQ
jgi:hypothetical protein